MKRKDFSNLKLAVQKEKETYFDHEEFIAGTPPYLRGVQASMYLQNPIINSILIAAPSPEKCNAILKDNISKGEKSFTFNFNLNSEKKAENGGIILNSTEDIQQLFKNTNLQNLDITISSNGNTQTILSLLLKGLKELNIPYENLKISVLFAIGNNEESIDDIFSYSSSRIPKLNTIILSSNPSNTISSEVELANLLTTVAVFLKKNTSHKTSIDSLANIISFNLNTSKNHFEDIAKMRAARLLWAKTMQQFNPKNQQSSALKLFTNTTNIIDVLTAFLGGSQRLNSLKTSQLFIEEETNILKTVDPWAGSKIIEKRTLEIINNTWNLIKS
ncbi:methylmalonyl-CoA mutase family protein [Lutibacter holmesii]|uniref:Methylmalonyl-CoA mutase family protein n=1 Tax=Lutibacter holmesii TaxID=1137985 RepID=A0ABW3WPR6_9FLAO